MLLLVGITGATGTGSRAGDVPRWLPDGGALFGTGAALAGTALLARQSAAFPLPGGAIGAAATLALDPLSALFLLLLFVVALAGSGLLSAPGSGWSRLGVAAVGLVIVAGDGVLLAASVPLALLVLVRMGGTRLPVRAVAALLGLLALMLGTVPGAGGAPGTAGFAVLRERIGTAGCVGVAAGTLLLMVAATPMLCPPVAARAGPGADRCRAVTLVLLLAQYGLLRIGFDLAAPLFGTPATGMVLFLFGTAAFVVLAVRALWADGLRGAVDALVVAPGALSVAALGAASAARGMDLPGPGSAATGAAVLLAVVQVLAGCSLLASGDNAVRELGSDELRHLGGAAASMRRAMAVAATGACLLGLLPPLGGYGGAWMLVHAVLAVARFSGSGPVVATTAAGIALGASGAALLALAWVRLAAAVALQKPRTPRAAAALDIGAGAFRSHALVLLPALLVSLLPGLPARLLPVPGLPSPDGIGMAPAAPGGGAGLAAAVPSLLLLLAVASVRAWVRRHGGPVREAPAWRNGMRADPPWLPFGDPLLQPGPRTMPAMVAAEFGPAILGPSVRTWIGAGAAAGQPNRYRRLASRWLRRAVLAAAAATEADPVVPAAVASAVLLAGWWLGS